MFELNTRVFLIEKYFKKLIAKNQLIIKVINAHKVDLSNKYCLVEISTGKYYCDLSIEITDLLNERKYGIIEIMNKLGLTSGKKILSDAEILESENIIDELENQIYAFGIIMDKYLSEIFNGNFSRVEENS